MTYPANVIAHPALKLLEYRRQLRNTRGRRKARLLVEIGRLLAAG